jgi:hypothetical protein
MAAVFALGRSRAVLPRPCRRPMSRLNDFWLRLPPYVYGRGGSIFVPMLMQMAVKAGESVYVGIGGAKS